MKKEMIVILGPTSSGKTALAIDLALRVGGAVISADSRQIYTGMNIGTAKPEEAWTNKVHDVLIPDPVGNGTPHRGRNRTAPVGKVSRKVDHYLFNITEPDKEITLAQWQSAAKQVIEKIFSEDKTPLLVGGTMLYIDSIIYNYAIPEVKPDVLFRGSAEKQDTAELYAELLMKDPDAKAFIQPHHKQRIIRALEVMKFTGKPFSKLRERRPTDFTYKIYGIFPGWEVLRERITKRTRQMLEDGLVEEVRSLRSKYSESLPLLKTINYQQAGQLLDRKISQEEAAEEMVQANMRYAHRQMSWWKRNKGINWISTT